MAMDIGSTPGHRTQVTLTQTQHAFLRSEAARTGLPIAELIRRAIERTYRPGMRPRLNGFGLSLGLWREPDAALAGRRPPRGAR